jgi:hypothetical protein
MHFNKFASRVIAVLVGGVALNAAIDFPVYGNTIFAGLLIYAVLLWRYSHAWMVVLPAVLPVLDLTPWSGRILLTEFDFLVLVTIAVAFWHGRFSFIFLKENRLFGWLLMAISISFAMSLLIGILRVEEGMESSYYLFHDSINGLRVSKGFWGALLFLPMLDYEKRSGKAIGRFFSLGMIVGLLMCSAVIAWERLMFPGLFNFSSDYRVSGMFSGMLLGGALLDGYLILALPFFISCFYFFRSRFFVVIGVLIFAGGIFSVLMTISRSTYLALAVSMLVLIVGGRNLSNHFTRRTRSLVVLSLVAIAIILPVMGGEFVRSRFSTISEDFKHRIDHWSEAVEIMDGPLAWLIGEGKGTFPAYYRQRTIDGQMMASFKHINDGENSFLRLSPSDARGDLFIRQKIPVNKAGEYRVTVRLRSHANQRQKLLIEFCERNILPLGHECGWKAFAVPASKKGQWIEISKRISGSGYSRGLSVFRPLEISLMNRGLKGELDISKIEIYSPSRRQIVRNSEFREGFDGWVFSSGNHLAWHVKNLWVSAFFEGGIIELLLISLYLFWLLSRCYKRSQSGEHFSTILLAALTGVMVVGFFGSFFDDPRVGWLFFMLSWFVVIPPAKVEEVAKTAVPWKAMILAIGGVGAAGVAVTAVQLMVSHHITARQLMIEGEKRLGVNLSWLTEITKPKARYLDHQFDGRVKASYPRIILPQLEQSEGRGAPEFIRERINGYKTTGERFSPTCHRGGLLPLTSCWLVKGEALQLEKIRNKLINARLVSPKAGGQYSNGWELALAYDLTFNALKKNQNDLSLIEKKIVTALEETLIILDENSASLWHGRTSHAAIAWLCAIVLHGDSEKIQRLRQRAQGHFLDAMSAVAYTEAWPEGYNYWIQNRALLVSLAASAYLNGLESSQSGQEIKEIMRRVGYWHIYATRPDNRIEGYADEGSRVDLKDETRRVIDVIAQMTQDPILAGYSKYLRKLHRDASYYRGYRWGFLLFNDPLIPTVGDGSLTSLGYYLPNNELFGKNAVNQAYFRSGWGGEDTFISFRAGHKFTHHGHYDAGHFSVFKDKPLAINSSTYGNIHSKNRLNYAVRTLAKNSLLIVNPDEKIPALKDAFSYGGQRVVMPTGSAVIGMQDWQNNYQDGFHFEGGELLAYEEVPGQYAYISSDITSAYNSTEYDENGEGGKVSQVLRSLLYLTDEDQLIIYDQVTATVPEYRKKWLLHSVNRPEVAGLVSLKGTIENGISESGASEAVIRNGKGVLKVTRLLPEKGNLRLVGGKDYQYFVENPQGESPLDGINQAEGARDKRWFDVGFWRMEIEPTTPVLKDEFLVVLSPSLDVVSKEPVRKLKVSEGEASGVLTAKSAVLFLNSVRREEVTIELDGGQERLIIANVTNLENLLINGQGKILNMTIRGKGLIEVDIRDFGRGTLHVHWS